MMTTPTSRAKQRRRVRALLATLLAVAALIGVEQALVPAPAGAVMQEGNGCSDSIWIFFNCEEANEGGGTGGAGSGGGGSGDVGSPSANGDGDDGGSEPGGDGSQGKPGADDQALAEPQSKPPNDDLAAYWNVDCSGLLGGIGKAARNGAAALDDAVDSYQACKQLQDEARPSITSPGCESLLKQAKSAAHDHDPDRTEEKIDDWSVCTAKEEVSEATSECTTMTRADPYSDEAACWERRRAKVDKLFEAEKFRVRDRREREQKKQGRRRAGKG